MWPSKTNVVGQAVIINISNQSAKSRFERSKSRVENLNAKLERLRTRRKRTRIIEQEIANTIVAIRSWSKVFDLAEFELNQNKGSES